jgi:glycosyltransferase involved in cell wall biosynthesis
MERNRTVSVIIPSRRKGSLQRCLASLENQTYSADRFEVIVVSPEKFIVEKASKVAIKNIVDSRANQAEARNIGEKQAKGDILAFCDDDCVLPPDWIENGVKPFSDSCVATVGGPTVPPLKDVSFNELITGLLMTSFLGTGSHRKAYTAPSKVGPHVCRPVEIIGANMFVDRGKFLEVGGFDRIVPQEEDRLNTEFVRKGHKIIYDPACSNVHYQRPYGTRFVRNIFWLMNGQGFLATSRLSPSSLYYLVPSLFVTGLIFGPFLFFIPYVNLVYFSTLILYVFSVFAESLRLSVKLDMSRQRKLGVFLTFPFVLFVHHVEAGCGFMLGSLRQLSHRIKLKFKAKNETA